MVDAVMDRIFKLVCEMRVQNRDFTDIFVPNEVDLTTLSVEWCVSDKGIIIRFVGLPIRKIDIPEIVIARIERSKVENQHITYAFCIGENYGKFEVASLDQPLVKVNNGVINLTYRDSIEELIKKQLQIGMFSYVWESTFKGI